MAFSSLMRIVRENEEIFERNYAYYFFIQDSIYSFAKLGSGHIVIAENVFRISRYQFFMINFLGVA
jgi:hypothetical protein